MIYFTPDTLYMGWKPMPRGVILFASAIMFLVTGGCGGASLAGDPSNDDIVYHNARYGLTFSLPATWRGYSVIQDEWDSAEYSPGEDKNVATGHGPMIIFRHPQWKRDQPRQDIPILVFTRRQWEADQGEAPIYAGGVEYEIAHNTKYVFAIYSRFDAADEVEGVAEAEQILKRNEAANGPHLIDR
jgi:hypothetical protein